MRIEIDDELSAKLDKIKSKEYSIYGKGHSETVRYLVKFHDQHQSIEKLIERELGRIQEIVEEANLNVVKKLLRNIFNLSSEKRSHE